MMRSAPLLSLLLLAAPLARAEEAHLTLLHTTDLHGSALAQDDLSGRAVPRGLEKLATLIRQVRAEGGPTLLMDAGDCIQGAPLASLYQLGDHRLPEPMMSAMNAIGYDAMAVGNHEFDFGPVARERARGDARFPWLAANIRRADGKPAFDASLVRSVGGITVGIIGLTTPAVASWEDSSLIAGLQFGSPVEAARAEVRRLREQAHCDVIVLLAHTGFEKDPVTGVERHGDATDENWGTRLATEVPGVDALVLGHTHAVVPSAEFPGLIAAQAGQFGEGLGRIDLTLTRDGPSAPWRVSAHRSRVIAVTDSIASDSTIARLMQPYHKAALAELDRVVAQVPTRLDAPHGRYEDGALWQLIHRAQREATGAQLSIASLPDASVRLGPGPVTARDLMRLYPFENTLVVLDLRGAEVRTALERSARAFQTYTFDPAAPLADPATPSDAYETLAGAQYSLDLTQPPGSRVRDLTVDGKPVSDAQRFSVVVNSDRAGRMKEGTPFGAARQRSHSARTVRDAIATMLAAGGAGSPGSVTGSGATAISPGWMLLPDYVTYAERPLIDRLVRQGVAPRAAVMRLGADEMASRGDAAYWLARSFGWHEKRRSLAFSDVPDSLEPWLDGLLKRGVLGGEKAFDRFRPFETIPLMRVLDWSEACARSAGYRLEATPHDPSFRRSLVTGVELESGAIGRFTYQDTLTRSQLLGMISNLRYPTVRVLETTDVHGAILPGARERRSGRPVGGSAVLAAHVARLRAEDPEGTVLLDGGDWYQGTMISNLAFGRPMIEQMNALGYVAAAIGNHEFDWTADTLEQRVYEFHGAALGANMKLRSNGKLPSWARADTTVTRRGVRVGIFGLCYPGTPSVTLGRYVTHLRFEDDSATSVPLARRLRQQGAAVVVGVGHIPGAIDSGRQVGGDIARLARGVHGVDAWFGGHSHNQVVGEVDGVPAMISGAHGEVIGVCDLVVDPIASRVIERRYRLEPTYGDAVTPDSAMARRVARWNRDIGPLAAEPIGRNATALTRGGAESTIGDLVANAMREGAQVDVALANSGGLRAELAAGVVTRGMVYEVMPFDNTVVTLRLSGAELKQALEDGLRRQRVTQVSGIRFSFDSSLPPGSRVTALTLADGRALDPGQDVTVAVNNFMADGGDEYNVLKLARDKLDTRVTVRQRLEEYVRSHSAGGAQLEIRTDGRIQRAAEASGK